MERDQALPRRSPALAVCWPRRCSSAVPVAVAPSSSAPRRPGGSASATTEASAPCCPRRCSSAVVVFSQPASSAAPRPARGASVATRALAPGCPRYCSPAVAETSSPSSSTARRPGRGASAASRALAPCCCSPVVLGNALPLSSAPSRSAQARTAASQAFPRLARESSFSRCSESAFPRPCWPLPPCSPRPGRSNRKQPLYTPQHLMAWNPAPRARRRPPRAITSSLRVGDGLLGRLQFARRLGARSPQCISLHQTKVCMQQAAAL
mmetsp:Transcript_967/g.2263  ORF Transcript_967/g.2263 Transcript_967/m.2263 type:complete len:266 (+) Transcript_967:1205-2002(+)